MQEKQKPLVLPELRAADTSSQRQPTADPIQELRRAVDLPARKGSGGNNPPDQAMPSGMALTAAAGRTDQAAAGVAAGFGLYLAALEPEPWGSWGSAAQQEQLERQYHERLAAAQRDFQKQLANMQVCVKHLLTRYLPIFSPGALLMFREASQQTLPDL